MIPSMFDRPSGVGALLGPGDIATPTASYSLRNLSISYFGQPVVRVRRESDDVEQDFTASQITDGTLGSFCTGTNGFVHTWYDQSGNGYDAVQVTDAEQPKIWDSVTGLVTENGRPALDFDGVDDYLATTSAYPTGTSASHFYVASSTGTDQRILDTRGTGTTGTIQGWQNKYSITTVVSIADDGLSALTTSAIARTGRNLVSVLFSQTQIDEYTNSVLADSATGSIGSFDSGNPLYIGANTNGANTQIFDGTTQEIVLYNSDQSVNRTAIEDNINNYYDIY